VVNADHRATDLQHDLRLLEKLSSDALRAMADTQKEVAQVQEEIAKIYAGVCERNHQVQHFLNCIFSIVPGGEFFLTRVPRCESAPKLREGADFYVGAN
jgi:hypothetical protein